MTTAQTFEFNRVVFFGRRFDEYMTMFGLKAANLVGKRVLDCAAGPAAFAAQAADRGINVVACDPMYALDAAELRHFVDKDARTVAEKQAKTPHFFHAELEPTPRRRQDMEVFLNDFENGRKQGRYLDAKLPTLPFPDDSFDFALQGNLLFLYSDFESGGMLEDSPFDYEFHSRSIKELIRLTKDEVRIYPLQGPNVPSHSYLEPIIAECCLAGHTAVVEPVAQRDIIGAEYMLRIVKNGQRR